MIESMLALAALQALLIAAVMLWTWIGGRQTRRAMRAQYPGRDYSRVWVNRDGRAWKYEITTGRIVKA